MVNGPFGSPFAWLACSWLLLVLLLLASPSTTALQHPVAEHATIKAETQPTVSSPSSQPPHAAQDGSAAKNVVGKDGKTTTQSKGHTEKSVLKRLALLGGGMYFSTITAHKNQSLELQSRYSSFLPSSSTPKWARPPNTALFGGLDRWSTRQKAFLYPHRFSATLQNSKLRDAWHLHFHALALPH